MAWKDDERLVATVAAAVQSCRATRVKTPLEALAASVHSTMSVFGFTFLSVTVDGARSSSLPGSSRELPQDWNSTSSSTGPSVIEFFYNISSDGRKRKDYASLKIVPLGSASALIAGARTGAIVNDEEIQTEESVATFETSFASWFDLSVLPLSVPVETDSEGASQAVRALFKPGQSMVKLAEKVMGSIVNQLFPTLFPASESGDGNRFRGPRPDSDPRFTSPSPVVPVVPAARPAGEEMPQFDDEFELQGRARPNPAPFAAGPAPLGSRDLYPPGLGPLDPLRQVHDPYAASPGGGMQPTFDDPIFQQGQGGQSADWDGLAPPGARFDPPGPFGNPNDHRPGRFPGGGPGSNQGPFGGGSGFLM